MLSKQAYALLLLFFGVTWYLTLVYFKILTSTQHSVDLENNNIFLNSKIGITHQLLNLKNIGT